MRRNKTFMAVMAIAIILSMLFVACGKKTNDTDPTQAPDATATTAPTKAPEATVTPAPTDPPPPTSTPEPSELEKLGLDENMRFFETRKISVEIYDRANDPGSPPDDNFYTDWIKQKMLEKHNVEVEYIRVGRWSEGADIANLLAAGDAPDVCVTYSYPTIETYGLMGGVYDMYPLLSEHGNFFPNLFELLGTTNVYWDKDPVDSHLWALEALLFTNGARTLTFVREDWLNKLGLSEPKTLQEFEDMLVAFRDNAELLLGAEAGKMIPLMQTHDVRWGMMNVQDGFLPNNFTDRDRFIHGAIEYYVTHPGTKETIKTYNKWYNMGLMWNDFSLYNNETLGSVADDLTKAGYVGAYTGNPDLPYRGGDASVYNVLKETVGPDAVFIPVDPFPNDSGKVVRLAPAPTDRKVFFPSTNDEPLASMFYVDFISAFDTRYFLQFGVEGKTHVIEDNGAIRVIAASGDDLNYIQNSPFNIDYTITFNSNNIRDTGDRDRDFLSAGLGYAGVDEDLIKRFMTMFTSNYTAGKGVNVGVIESAVGLETELTSKRDVLYVNAITVKPEDFESTWDTYYNDLMRTGLEAIKKEREDKWAQFYGSAEWIEN